MTNPHDSQFGVFYPNELALLTRVVEKVCRWHDLKEESADADELAARAISLFSSGITDEDVLFKKLRRIPYRSAHAISDTSPIWHG